MMFGFCVFLSGISFVGALSAKDSSLYELIESLPFDDHGWFTNQALLELQLQKKQPQVIIEVGSWLGASARFMAQRISEDGIVYAVDT